MSPPCTPHRVVARAASGPPEAKDDAGGGGGGGGGGRGRANAGECGRMRATASRRLRSVQRSATVDVASAINHIIARHCQRAAGGLLFGACAAAQASECFAGAESEGSPFFICALLLFREPSPTGSRPGGLIGHHQRQKDTPHSQNTKVGKERDVVSKEIMMGREATQTGRFYFNFRLPRRVHAHS